MSVSKVELMILGLIAEEPSHGYGVLERFRQRSMDLWIEVGRASVYQALRRMEADGLISGREQERADGPDRRVFRVTRAGRERLRSSLTESAAIRGPYDAGGGLALGFVHLLPVSEARRMLDGRDLAVRDHLDAIRSERARTSADHGPGRVVSDAMLDRQEALARAELPWLAAFRSRLGRVHR
jgi:DNA-binding PadR family transcriptional regulator